MVVDKERELGCSQIAPRRRLLSSAHRPMLPDDFFQRRISEDEQAEKRLEEIRGLLDLEISRKLAPRERAILEVELIWLEFRIGRITSEERQSRLLKKLDVWEKEEGDLFNWLIGENGNGFNLLSRIRDRVISPRRKKRG